MATLHAPKRHIATPIEDVCTQSLLSECTHKDGPIVQ